MTDASTPAPSQTVVVSQPAASTRWIPIIASLLGMLGSLAMMGGTLMTIGGWRAQVDASIADLSRRMNKAEANQSTYIPVLIGLSKDVTYLAERARREDDRRERERH